MLAVIDQFRLHHDEDIHEYKRLWRQLVRYYVREGGALGSCLHRSQEGWWLAYSRWPDQQARQKVWPESDEDFPEGLPVAIQSIITSMRALIAEKKPEWILEVVDDMLLPETGEPVLF